MDVAVTGVGVVCASGNGVEQVLASIGSNQAAIVAPHDERSVLDIPGVAEANVDVRPLLKRRKDRKLLPRAAELAIVASYEAYGEERTSETALFLGVGREPAEEDTEGALIAAMREGVLDVELLQGPGLAAYPPLAPLKTLPNMILAHVAIQLGCQGEGGTRAGAEAAGVAAAVAGYQSITEGRTEVALVGGADSLVGAGTARDLIRMERLPKGTAPGEGAAFLRLESMERATRRGAEVLAVVNSASLGGRHEDWRSPLEASIGACGTASALLWIALEIARGRSGQLAVTEPSGASAQIGWTSVRGRTFEFSGEVR